MKKTIILTIFLLAKGLIAQEENKNAITLNWGIGHLTRQDLTASPMIHKDVSPVNAMLGYKHFNKFEHEVEVKFGMYNPKPTESYDFFFEPEEILQTFNHSFILLDVNYSFGKSVYTTDKLKVVAGARMRNRLNASDYAYGAISLFAYYFSFGLDARLKMDYEINEKSKLHFSAALPLFSMNSRSPYLATDAEYLMDNYAHKDLSAVINFSKRAKFQSWGKSQGIEIGLGYDYSISEKWSIGCDYLFLANFNQVPTNFSSIENTLFLGAKLKF